jgi:hypothetical protein
VRLRLVLQFCRLLPIPLIMRDSPREGCGRSLPHVQVPVCVQL